MLQLPSREAEAAARVTPDLIGCAAEISETCGRADWGDRRWSVGAAAPIDHDVDVGALRYRVGIGERVEQAMAEHAAEFEVLGP